MRLLVTSMLLIVLPGIIWAVQDTNSLIIDEFEGNGPKLGRLWEVSFDKKDLGTKVNPFVIEKSGSPKSPKGHGHFSGHVGKLMEPWPYALVQLDFQKDGPKDLSVYKTIQFYAKGDGKQYRVSLGRKAITDYCYYEHEFTAPKDWTLVVCKLDDFTQPDVVAHSLMTKNYGNWRSWSIAA
jgi:Complex I intermediate-associated protein 30 (CIA30)